MRIDQNMLKRGILEVYSHGFKVKDEHILKTGISLSEYRRYDEFEPGLTKVNSYTLSSETPEVKNAQKAFAEIVSVITKLAGN
ncbi:Uncharacterised protein [Candidatus Norongarragalina meridionalis]|nr:Uncharacterised protein [Candidatus Norongarragalina meridionalis]